MPVSTRTIRVVVDLGSDPPQPLGSYVRTDEAVVVYQAPSGRIAGAPDDCVVVVDLDLFPDARQPAGTLESLHAALGALVGHVDDDTNVPERYEHTLRGLLADADSDALRRAKSVVHRLMVWDRHPNVSPERYFAPGRGPSQ